MTEFHPTASYWSDAATPAFPPLTEDVETDVVVIGAGVTGLTTAYLLVASGKRVVVLERGRLASIDTGHTSAHLTMVTDVRITELVNRLGAAHAQAVWDAGQAAIAQIAELVRTGSIDAGFEWVDGYLHAPAGNLETHSRDEFEREARVASELGFDVEYVDDVPLMHVPGMRVSRQARIHPVRYAAGLARAIVEGGGRIHEDSEADAFSDDPRSVTANGHTITCEDIVVATHNPLVGLAGMAGATLFQTKLALYTSYVVAGHVPKGTCPDALWWDTADPYRYLRIEARGDADLVIFGGADHKTGQQDDTRACYRTLERALETLVPGIDLTHRWSGQVIETPDGLPYIGRMVDHQYAATGFGGNGLTFGTLAGMMLSDAILERRNPWADLFSPDRKALGRSLWDYVKENVDYPYYMIRDRFAARTAHTVRTLRRGEGCVIDQDGENVAAYRDDGGAVVLRSAVCPHMGCLVMWNTAERTWDCPCHGSRFTPAGDVLSGPAEQPLSALAEPKQR